MALTEKSQPSGWLLNFLVRRDLNVRLKDYEPLRKEKAPSLISGLFVGWSQLMLSKVALYGVKVAAYGVTHNMMLSLKIGTRQPQVPTAPHAVQKSQPSLRIIVWFPHSGQSLPWVGSTLLLVESSGASRMPICCSGKPLSSRMPSIE